MEPHARSEPTSRSWAEQARDAVRAAGHNHGAARDALIELFAEQECALSVPELEQRLERERPVGRASIYRALEVLSGLGMLARVDLGDGLLRYERVEPDQHGDGNPHHHHHMVCDGCGRLIAFDDDQLETAIEGLSARYGFDARGHEVTLRGICVKCR